MDSHFEAFSEDEILAINEAVVQTKYQESVACRCLLVGRNLFSCTPSTIHLPFGGQLYIISHKIKTTIWEQFFLNLQASYLY